MVVGVAELVAADDLGVASVLEWKKGCLLLRGIPIDELSRWPESDDGWSEIDSCASSSSKEGRSRVDFLGLPIRGNGDGLRGPSGRRSLEGCDRERERGEGDAPGEASGVSGIVCGVQDLGVCECLDDREPGLNDVGGSSAN